MHKSGNFVCVLFTKAPGLGLGGWISKKGVVSASVIHSTNRMPPTMAPVVTVGADRVRATFTTPQLPELNGTGVTLANLPRVVELTRRMRQSAWKNDFLDMQKIRESAFNFIAGIRYQFYSSPLADTAITVGNIGTSSFETKLSMTLPQDGNHSILAVNNIMFWVHMDRKTRKPSPLPDWFQKKYRFAAAIAKSEKVPSLRLPKYQKPTWIYRTITRDEIDKFGHTNYEKYIEFVLDSVQTNLVHPRNQPLDGSRLSSILTKPVKQVDMLFSGETRLGDDLQICSWLTTNQGMDTVYSMVYKHGSPIMHCTFKLDNSFGAKL